MRLLFGFEITRPKPKTALHPDYKTLVEFAFDIEGVSYYSFKNGVDWPTRRLQSINQFLREVDLRMSSKDLKELMKLQREAIDKGMMTEVVKIIITIEKSIDLYMELDTYYRLFSATYFTLKEDISDYDWDYNDEKIELFKKEKLDDFFFKGPLKKYLPQTNISKQDIQTLSKLSKRNKMFRSQNVLEIMKSLSENGSDSGGG